MKKAILLALLSSVMLASCATVDVRTEISPNGSAKREIDAYVDNTTYRYDKNTVDSYTKELAERGSGSVSVTQDNGGLKITTKLSADSIQALNAKTTKLFTQSGSSCGFSVNGSFDSFGILQKDITVKEAITTKCLEYIT